MLFKATFTAAEVPALVAIGAPATTNEVPVPNHDDTIEGIASEALATAVAPIPTVAGNANSVATCEANITAALGLSKAIPGNATILSSQSPAWSRSLKSHLCSSLIASGSIFGAVSCQTFDLRANQLSGDAKPKATGICAKLFIKLATPMVLPPVIPFIVFFK